MKRPATHLRHSAVSDAAKAAVAQSPRAAVGSKAPHRPKNMAHRFHRPPSQHLKATKNAACHTGTLTARHPTPRHISRAQTQSA